MEEYRVVSRVFVGEWKSIVLYPVCLQVSGELERSGANLGDVTGRARELEEQVTDNRSEIKKRDAELKVSRILQRIM